jgi:hypothetical protein
MESRRECLQSNKLSVARRKPEKEIEKNLSDKVKESH